MDKGKLNITVVQCGVYQANCYMVSREGRSDAFLIDPGDRFRDLERTIDASGLTITDILLTHGHFDHILSAPRAAQKYGARVHIHLLDAHMLKSAAASLYHAEACFDAFMPMDITHPLPDEDGALFTVCGVPLTLIKTPGHTRGSVCFLSSQHAALFSGDTLFESGYGRVDFPGGSAEDMSASLRKLFTLAPDTCVYPGHGGVETLERIREGGMIWLG